MPQQPTLRRSAAVLAAATAAVFAALAPASVAYADDTVRVSLGGLNSTQTAGASRPDNFTVEFNNRTKQSIANPRVTFVVHVDGLSPDQVDMARGNGFTPLNKSTNGGDVVFSDPQPFTFILQPGKTVSRQFQIVFGAQAPPGQGQLSATAVDGTGNQLGSANAGFTVRAGNGARPSLTPSPSASPAPTVNVPIQSASAVSLAPLGDQGRATPPDSSGGVPVFIYIMGGILVAMGGAILFLLFRNPREPAGVGAPGDGPPPSGYPEGYFGYPSSPRAGSPTAIMPIIRDPRANPTQPLRPTMDRTTAQHPRIAGNDPRITQPGVDPWANADVDDTIHGGPGPIPRR